MDKDSSLYLETLPIRIRKPCLHHSFFILDSFSFLDLENFLVASLEAIWILTFLLQVGNLIWVGIFILLGIHLQLGIPRWLGILLQLRILCWLGFHLLIRRFPTSTRKPCSSRKHHLQIFNFVHPLGSKHMMSIPSSNLLQKAPKCILLHTLPLKPENT